MIHKILVSVRFNPSEFRDMRRNTPPRVDVLLLNAQTPGKNTIPFVADVSLLGVYISDEKTPSRV